MCFHQVRENQTLNVVTVTSDNMMMLKSLFNAFENQGREGTASSVPRKGTAKQRKTYG